MRYFFVPELERFLEDVDGSGGRNLYVGMEATKQIDARTRKRVVTKRRALGTR